MKSYGYYSSGCTNAVHRLNNLQRAVYSAMCNLLAVARQVGLRRAGCNNQSCGFLSKCFTKLLRRSKTIGLEFSSDPHSKSRKVPGVFGRPGVFAAISREIFSPKTIAVVESLRFPCQSIPYLAVRIPNVQPLWGLACSIVS